MAEEVLYDDDGYHFCGRNLLFAPADDGAEDIFTNCVLFVFANSKDSDLYHGDIKPDLCTSQWWSWPALMLAQGFPRSPASHDDKNNDIY